MPKIVRKTDKDVLVDIRDDEDYDWIRLRRRLKQQRSGNANKKTYRGKKAKETKRLPIF